jgi:hypothetical protein
MRVLLIVSSVLLTFSICAQNYEVFVSGRTTSTVKKYDEFGNYLGDFVSAGSGGLAQTEDILFHPNGSVLVTGYNSNAIKEYDGISGNFLGNFSMGYTLTGPSKMTIGPDSLIYVTQWGGDYSIVRFDLNGNYVDQFTGALNNALMHLWDADTNFYVAEFGNGGDGVVHKFDKNGADLGIFINSSILQGPTGMWRDETGDFFVEDWTTGEVQRFDSLGIYEGVFISGMSQPEGVAFLPNGDILIGDWGTDLVHRFDSLGNPLSTFTVGNGLGDPNSVKVRMNPEAGLMLVDELNFSMGYDQKNGTLNIFIDQVIKDCRLHIYSNDGRLIQHTAIDGTKEKVSLQLESGLASGTYLVKLNFRQTGQTNVSSWSEKLYICH